MTCNVETQVKEQIDQNQITQNNCSDNEPKKNQEQQEQAETIKPNNNEIQYNLRPAPQAKSDQKRPPNAYILFCCDHREEVKNQNPTLTAMEVNQILSKMWKELGESKINEYKTKAKKLFETYKEENPNYHYKTNSKPSKRVPVRINQKDAFQIVNHLFQNSPFMLQQMLLEKDKKGHLDITKMFTLD